MPIGNQRARSAGASNFVAGATNTQARADLIQGIEYKGTVVDYAPDRGVYGVMLDDVGVALKDVVWGAGIIAGMMGLKAKFIPTLGTRVAVVLGHPCWISGCLPGKQGSLKTAQFEGVTTELKLRQTLKGMFPGVPAGVPVFDEMDIPSDMLPGELDMTNIFSVGVKLLTNFSKLQAGEGAKVECHLLNDMVRIISNTFRHHSAVGDEEIFDDGRLNMEFNATSMPHEAWGILQPTDEKVKADGKGVDFSSIDAIKATGRWRFSSYLGFVGNFLHMLLSDPTEQLGVMAASALRAGKFGTHIDQDGSFLMQSCADIAFEHVVRVPVPIRVKRHEDPEGVRVADFESLESKYLQLWKYPTNKNDMFEMAFQLREYARYLSQFQALARFHQLEAKNGEFKVPSESETPIPEWTSKQPDVEKVNSGLPYKYYETYACWRIMRDGSIVFWAGDGSGVVMAAGNVKISAARNLELEAAGDISMVAGQNIYVKARRNMELVAVTGGTRIKSRAFMHALCEWGTLWLKSDAQDPKAASYQANTPDDPEEDPAIILNDAAVLIESSRGRTTLDSERCMMLHVRGAGDGTLGNGEDDDVSGSIVLQSKRQHVKLRADRSLWFQADKGMVGIKAERRSVVVKSQSMWLRLKTNLRIFDNVAFDRSGRLRVPVIRTKTLSAVGQVIGPNRELGSPKHGAHMTPLPDDADAKAALGPALAESEFELTTADDVQFDTVEVAALDPYPAVGELTFKFDKAADYVPDRKIFLESHTQQFIRKDAENGDDYKITSPGIERLKGAPRVDASTAPWPGAGSQHRRHDGGKNLRKPTGDSGLKLFVNTPLKAQAYSFRFLKRTAQHP